LKSYNSDEFSDAMAAINEMETVLQVKVLPRSSRNAIVGKEEGLFRVKLTAPPVEGKANKALIGFLAKTLGVSSKDIEIISGKRSRKKSVRISGMSPIEVERLLQ
jgi:uncharacterized protein (TIGR00251 family)